MKNEILLTKNLPLTLNLAHGDTRSRYSLISLGFSPFSTSRFRAGRLCCCTRRGSWLRGYNFPLTLEKILVMENSDSRKRKHGQKYYHAVKRTRWGALTVGVKGFLCTCNAKSKDCTREAYNILNEYADKLIPEEEEEKKKDVEDGEPNESETDETEVDKDLKKEVEALKHDAKNHQSRFNYLDPGVNGCVFIKTTLPDPVGLTYTIMKDVQRLKQSKTKYLLRMVPVEVICKAYIDDIKKAAEKLFESHFKGEAKTFAIVLNRRNNSNVGRDELIQSLAQLVKDRNIDHKADLKNADLTVVVELLKNLCCLSVVPEFGQLRKYNLVELGNSK